MTKRKEQRKELLKDDEFHSTLEQLALKAQENAGQVTAIIGGFFLVLGAFFLYGWYADSQQKESAFTLYKAEKILDTAVNDEKAELKFSSEKEKYEAALAELDRVIAAESGVVQQQALVHKAQCLIALGRSEEVKSTYEALAKSSGDLKSIGVMGLADMDYAAKRYQDAMSGYQSLLRQSGGFGFKDLIRYKIAQCYIGLEDKDKAISELKGVISEYDGVEDRDKPPVHLKVKELLTELEPEATTTEG